MQTEELIRNFVESEGRKECYSMVMASDESDSGICYMDITLSEGECEKLKKLYTKYGSIFFCNHLEEEFSAEELEFILSGVNPKNVEGIFFEEPCYLILHGYNEKKPSSVGYLSVDENYYLSYDVIRLSKEDYIKLLVALTGPEMKITDLKFKDLKKTTMNYSIPL